MRYVYLLLAMVAAISFCAPTWAAADTDANTAEQSNMTAPDQIVRQTSKALLATLHAKKDALLGHPDAVYKIVNQKLSPVFDFKYAARLVLGRAWGNTSAEQRHEFINAFKHYLVNNYANVLIKYSNTHVKVKPFRGLPSDRNADIVSLLIPAKSKKPIKVHYAMIRTKDGWKVFDVRASGVSYVMSKRNTFAKQIRKQGVDGLIKSLQDKAKKAAHEARQQVDENTHTAQES